MVRRSVRDLAASAALAVVVLVPAAACGPGPVSPLPAEAQSTSPTTSPLTSPTPPTTTRATASPARPAPRPRVRPTVTRSPSTPPSPACLGAVVHTLTADTELALVSSICLAVGGILRVEGTGPGTVSADPPDAVSLYYEAGVVECRFLSPGKVTVSIDRDEQTHAIPVVVR